MRATRFLNVRERAGSYWAALSEAGVAEAEMPVMAVTKDAGNIREALALPFEGGPPPVGLLTMADLAGMAAVEWLANQGFRVPEEVSVVGFDGAPEFALSRPPLTNVEQPYRRIAGRSVAVILDDAMPSGCEVLPLTLVVRGSTDPAPA